MQRVSVKKNLIYQVSYQILTILLPLVTSPYVSRVLGAEMIGEYSYCFSIANYFVLFAALGIQNYGNREIAINKNDKQSLNETFNSIYWFHFCSSLAFIILYFVFILMFQATVKYAIIIGIYVLSSIFDITWFYFGIENFKLTSMSNIVIKILSAIMIFIFVNKEEDLWLYCLIMALSYFVSEIILWFPLKRYVKLSKMNLRKSIAHFKPLLILFIPTIAVSLYKLMDKIMLGVLTSKIELAYYENAEKICNVPIVIVASFGNVMLPRMANLLSQDENNQFNKYIKTSITHIMCIAFAMGFGLAAVAKSFAPVFWGKTFSPCADLMVGLSIT